MHDFICVLVSLSPDAVAIATVDGVEECQKFASQPHRGTRGQVHRRFRQAARRMARNALAACASMVIFVSRFVVNIPSIGKILVKIKVFAFFSTWHSDCRKEYAPTRRRRAKAKSGSGDAKLNQQFRVADGDIDKNATVNLK
jgi:hypothetical protein